MNNFLIKRIQNYFDTSITPARCIEYLGKIKPIKYDHMAFRTINKEDFTKLSKIILSARYKRMDETIEIPLKNKSNCYKYAHWFKNENYLVPRIFLSQAYMDMYYSNIVNSNYYSKEIKIQKLQEKSDDYILWTYLHGDEINHLAVDMSDYPDFEERIYQMAKDLDLEMNDSAGLFQVSEDKKLIQCSTKADKLENGQRKNYIEFVKRIDGRDGFEGNNAYGIFQSTK